MFIEKVGTNMKQTIGYILLLSYWGLSLIVAINYSHLGQILGLVFVPVVIIPMQIIQSLFSYFWYGIIELVWISLGLYLIVKGNNDR